VWCAVLGTSAQAQEVEPLEPLLSGAALDAHLYMPLPGSRNELSLIFNGYRRGTIEPCGCISHKLGGIDKEARLERQLADKNMPFVHVDAGGFVKDPTVPHAVALSALQMQAFELMHVDAMNVSFHDLGIGVAALHDSQTSFSLPLISCNVLDETSRTIFAPVAHLTRALSGGRQVRVSIVGATRMRIPQTSKEPQRLATSHTPCFVSDPEQALRKTVPEARRDCDLLIVLLYDTSDAARDMLRRLEGEARIDVLVAGESRGQLTTPSRIGNTWIVGTGFEGRQVGHMQLHIGDEGITSASAKMVEVVQNMPPVPELTTLVKKAAELKLN
jgi:2',3'-cyclic-nucleotide 2'-phosphodiesterase (5'-nucleotidase family)